MNTLNWQFKKIVDKADRPVVPMPDQAYIDINDDIVDELGAEIETSNLITCDCVMDCHPDPENLLEWLKMYYRVEKK